ncbi:hypothetical protein VTN31DRAFT_3591 [Thermomyces dupontii]|uniref:uncharacterized protein n=1 Tax=Talaromyces thermophilus TaxID=28565 RepID=UPI0037436BBE
MFGLCMPGFFSLIILGLALLPSIHAVAVNPIPSKNATQEVQFPQFFDCTCKNATTRTSYNFTGPGYPDVVIRNMFPGTIPNVTVKLWLETQTVTLTATGSNSKSKTTSAVTTTLHPTASKVETGNPKATTYHHTSAVGSGHSKETVMKLTTTLTNTPSPESKQKDDEMKDPESVEKNLKSLFDTQVATTTM